MPRDDPLILQEPPPMLGQLTGPSRPPLSGGKPRRLVILLHGLGADGNDLIGLQQRWGRVVPDAEFISPNAPFPCDMAPYGYQWFSVQDRTPAALLAGLRAAVPSLDAFIDEELQKRGLTEADTVLVGFSQGTMMSLYIGRRLPQTAAQRSARLSFASSDTSGRNGCKTFAILSESHSAAPSTRPTTLPSLSIIRVVGRPRTEKACPTALFGSR